MTRLLTAAVLVPLTWYLCKRAPFPAFLVAALVVVALASWEAYGLLQTRGSRPFRSLGVLLCLATAWGFAAKPAALTPLAALSAAAVLVPVGVLWRRDDPAAMLDAAVTTVAPVLFVGFTLGHCVGLRAVAGEDGSDLLMLLLVCVALADAAAYYVGTAFGRHPLAPKVSPKKSWEGAAGGLAGSVAGSMLAHFWFFQRLSVPHALAIAAAVWAAGIVGDLAESAWKRAAGVKDSSALLPGHGGMLDRIDGLLVAGPVLYYYWRAFLAA
ncbi:MAG TPA: phosphatidate cytidylyltransferase [Candidatus Sulfotelmatobacter sp.]|jgi:phosphatidate cytidylyltransferase|nr:phosphatidate cytidylyltransferase [Candidatus Sulfotelmatobacter sp.]